MKVYFTPTALERIAKEQALYTWDYTVRNDDDTPPKDSILAAAFEPVFPSKAACVAPALAAIAEREKELRKELNAELAKLDERRNDLIMLEFQA